MCVGTAWGNRLAMRCAVFAGDRLLLLLSRKEALGFNIPISIKNKKNPACE
jgi:hypothetical protein